jgi:hypothetical protein
MVTVDARFQTKEPALFESHFTSVSEAKYGFNRAVKFGRVLAGLPSNRLPLRINPPGESFH